MALTSDKTPLSARNHNAYIETPFPMGQSNHCFVYHDAAAKHAEAHNWSSLG